MSSKVLPNYHKEFIFDRVEKRTGQRLIFLHQMQRWMFTLFLPLPNNGYLESYKGWTGWWRQNKYIRVESCDVRDCDVRETPCCDVRKRSAMLWRQKRSAMLWSQASFSAYWDRVWKSPRNKPYKDHIVNVMIHPSIHPSIYPSIRPSIHPSIHPLIYLWIYLSQRLNPAQLLRLYVNYDLLREAAALAMEYIDAVLGTGKEYFGLKVKWKFIKWPGSLQIARDQG